MTSDKKGASLLAEVFVRKGLKNIIISPGSRNAPLILSFAQNPLVEAISIVDERSAAYFALGMAQQSRKTVALACTSGGAVLNYAPAVAEAYYQKVPLLVITADRPEEMIDQGDGQTIRQKNVFANYVKASFEIPGDIHTDQDFKRALRIVNEAINQTTYPDSGPVHINIPFSEPIYNQVAGDPFEFDLEDPPARTKTLSKETIDKYASTWNARGRKLLVIGMMDPDPEIRGLLRQLADDPSVVVLTETTSNLMNDCSCACIDKVVNTITDEEMDLFKPELLVSLGGNVISKMVKSFLRKNKPMEHWHIDPAGDAMDTYQCLTDAIEMNSVDFFRALLPKVVPVKSDYFERWNARNERSEKRHQAFLSDCNYTDLKVFETLLEDIPAGSCMQLGNSTPVRYVQLFKQKKEGTYYSNRGTSGIDGAVSTAAGAAHQNNQLTVLITGDLGFFYDSNALMNHHLKGNLRIIIINNKGGGIFRFIPGPADTDQLEEFFEARHNWTAEFIAKNFNVPYYSAVNLDQLNSILPGFFDSQEQDKPAILEIHTPNEINASVLKSYFNFLKE